MRSLSPQIAATGVGTRASRRRSFGSCMYGSRVYTATVAALAAWALRACCGSCVGSGAAVVSWNEYAISSWGVREGCSREQAEWCDGSD